MRSAVLACVDETGTSTEAHPWLRYAEFIGFQDECGRGASWSRASA
jgi:hypothetical protein